MRTEQERIVDEVKEIAFACLLRDGWSIAGIMEALSISKLKANVWNRMLARVVN